MEGQPCIFLGIKVKPGPIEQFKLENFALDNTVDRLKNEAESKVNVPSSSLEAIHHGKILKDNVTLQDCGVKSGEMVHVVKKKTKVTPTPTPNYTDAELQQINNSLRALGCTPNAPGWTRAMQLLNDESAMAEIIEQEPSLSEDCVALSILHEVELLAALGANVHTMRRGANAHPALPNALRHLTRLVRSRSNTNSTADVPTSGFAYSLEALSEDEDADDEETDDGERSQITHAQLAAALQAATEAVSSTSGAAAATGSAGGGASPAPRPASLLRLLTAPTTTTPPLLASSGTPGAAGGIRPLITPEMFSEAITAAINRASNNAGTPMDQSVTASSSHSPMDREDDFSTQLQHMHEMGLLDDALNIRALLISSGDVNAAINLVFSGAIGDD